MAKKTVTIQGVEYSTAYLGQASDGEPFYTKNEWEMEGHRDIAEQRGATFEYFDVLVPSKLYLQIG